MPSPRAIGLIDFNTPGQKLRASMARGALPPAMTTPPVIGAASLTANAALTASYAWNSASLTPLRCSWLQVGANPRAAPVSVAYDGVNQTPNSGLCGGMGSYFFVTDSPLFEINGFFDAYRIYVDEIDGKGWQDAGTLASAGTGSQYYVPVDWSAVRKFRKYRIDFGLSCQFYGLKMSPIDTVYPYTRINPLRAVLIGDSFPEGTGATYPWLDSYGVGLGFLYGIDDFVVSGSGGTGLIQTNGPRVVYSGRIQIDAIARNPDIIFIQGSQNDNAYSPAACQAALTTLIATIRASSTAKIVVIGLWNTRGTNATAATINTALQATAATLGVDFWDWYSFITGTGKVGATTGDGNADLAVAGDGVHSSTFGHKELRAKRLAEVGKPYIQTWL